MEAGSRTGTRYAFSFTGKGGEYFKIWIVNIFLTIITLYIYSAWAKVRTNRYFHGHTVLDYSGFEYHVQPTQILLSRIIALVLLIVVTLGSVISPVASSIATAILFLILPWAMWRSTRFNARMSSYRNVRFGFSGKLGPLLLYQIVLPALPFVLFVLAGVLNHKGYEGALYFVIGGTLSMFLLIPLTHKLVSNYYLNYYQYGKSQFEGTLSTWFFYRSYFLCVLFTIVFLLIFAGLCLLGVWLSGNMASGEVSFLDYWLGAEGQAPLENVAGGLLPYTLIFVAAFAQAYLRARVRAHLYARALLAGRVSFESTVRVWPLWWVMSSNLLFIVLTLGLFVPFAKVRMARYLAANTFVFSAQFLDGFAAERREEVGAFGEELGDAFDMGMDVGF